MCYDCIHPDNDYKIDCYCQCRFTYIDWTKGTRIIRTKNGSITVLSKCSNCGHFVVPYQPLEFTIKYRDDLISKSQ